MVKYTKILGGNMANCKTCGVKLGILSDGVMCDACFKKAAAERLKAQQIAQ